MPERKHEAFGGATVLLQCLGACLWAGLASAACLMLLVLALSGA